MGIEKGALTDHQIAAIFDNLALQTEYYYEARAEELKQQLQLEHNVDLARAEGRIEGRNAELRQANARALFKDQHTTYAKAQANAALARIGYERAQAEASGVRARLQLMELEKELANAEQER